jgi:prephenate dehydrogenase
MIGSWLAPTRSLIDTGADEALPFSPPSFRALAQTIETVRADAGHLFLAIQRDNPEAAAARLALINALSRTHDEIERAPVDQPPDASVSIDEQAGDPTPELMETRDLIDDLDRELMRLLARRAALSNRAGSIKARQARPIRDTTRESQLLEDRRDWASELGLSEDAIVSVFEAVLAFSRDTQV